MRLLTYQITKIVRSQIHDKLWIKIRNNPQLLGIEAARNVFVSIVSKNCIPIYQQDIWSQVRETSKEKFQEKESGIL